MGRSSAAPRYAKRGLKGATTGRRPRVSPPANGNHCPREVVKRSNFGNGTVVNVTNVTSVAYVQAPYTRSELADSAVHSVGTSTLSTPAIVRTVRGTRYDALVAPR